MAKKKGKNKLKIGRFYNVRDGSEKGHPGKIVSIDKRMVNTPQLLLKLPITKD